MSSSRKVRPQSVGVRKRDALHAGTSGRRDTTEVVLDGHRMTGWLTELPEREFVGLRVGLRMMY